MRREWFIVAGVLVPFAALIVVGFIFSARPVATTALEPLAPKAVMKVLDAGLRALVPDISPTPTHADAGAPIAAAIEAPVRAVLPEIHACFVDNGAHLHGRQAVVIAFRPTPSGTFSDVTVETRVVSPQLQACFEDVFAELHFALSGRETFELAKYTFLFDAPLE